MEKTSASLSPLGSCSDLDADFVMSRASITNSAEAWAELYKSHTLLLTPLTALNIMVKPGDE